MGALISFQQAIQKRARCGDRSPSRAALPAAKPLSGTEQLILLRIRLRAMHPQSLPMDPDLLGLFRW